MGKGLGCLQKAIMLFAYEKYKQDSTAIVTAREILSRHYGFPTNQKQIGEYGRSEAFNIREIGFKRYMSATVTVSQCFSRLAARGLVEYELCHGVWLTRSGVKQARKILVEI